MLNAPFFYCVAHQLRFRPSSETTILCEQGEHELGNGFPNESWWTYCCDCATFWPAEFTKSAGTSKACLVCDRVTARRYLCNTCQVVSIETSELVHRKTHFIDEQGITPGCPACKTAARDRTVEHNCPEIGIKFLTARTSCAFCQQQIGNSAGVANVETAKCWSCSAQLVAPFKFCKRCGKSQDQRAPVPAISSSAAAPTIVDETLEPPVTVTGLEWEADDSNSNDEPLTDLTTDAPEVFEPEPVSATASEASFSSSWPTSTVLPPKRRTKWSFAVIAIVVCAGILVPVFALYGERKKGPVPPSVKTLPAAPPGMTYISGGEFLMGTDDGDEYERPAHRVSVAPFYMDLTEVTCEMYQEFVRVTNHRAPPNWTNNAYPSGAARLAVTGVDWYDADAYAKWAKKRLPTEEEWEFAARSNDGRRYPWGNTWLSGAANAGDSSAQRVVNVGGFAQGKTPSGLMDLAGNAWEWTSSELVAYPNGKLPEKPRGEIKIIRGGSWQGTTSQITTTYRGYLLASGGDDYSATGFRCVRDAHPISPSKEN